MPTSEPGRGDDGEVRFGTISGTSAAAAVTAGVAAVLAQGRPVAGRPRAPRAARRIGAARQTSTRQPRAPAWSICAPPSSRSCWPSPSLLSFGAVSAPFGAERRIVITNVSTRRLSVTVGNAAIAPKGVEITIDPAALPPAAGSNDGRGRSRRYGRPLGGGGRGYGELVLAVGDSPEVHVPWTVAVPASRRPRVAGSRWRRRGHASPTPRRRRSRSWRAR